MDLEGEGKGEEGHCGGKNRVHDEIEMESYTTSDLPTAAAVILVEQTTSSSCFLNVHMISYGRREEC